MAEVARLSEPPHKLLLRAAGGPRQLAHKARLFGRAALAYRGGAAVRARMERLVALGIIDALPTRVQLAVGAADMLRFFITPAARDYYDKRGIDFTFHQVLRFLQDPRAVVDPIGLISERDGIISHLMQVVHANPVYDCQLLAAHEGGLEELERQLEQVIAGTHPETESLRAIVEEADYHARLLAFVRAFRRDPQAPPPKRDNIAGDPALARAEEVFGTMTHAMRYMCRLPTSVTGALRHLARTRSLPA